MILLISFSLNPESNSFEALRNAYEYLNSKNIAVKFIDMRKCLLPFYNGTNNILNNKNVKGLLYEFNKARKIIISTPIYNMDVNAVLKNFIDILSLERYTNKLAHKQVIGFIGAMGSERGYASLLPTIASFQFSLEAYCIPKIVVCLPSNFDQTGKIENTLIARIKELCNTIINEKI